MEEKSIQKNPYDWINPVLNVNQFAGRSEKISKIMNELILLKGDNQINPIVAIIGERRVGKTSLLFRINENCINQSLVPLFINIDDRIANDIWEFWKEVFYDLLTKAQIFGINLVEDDKNPIGFHVQRNEEISTSASLNFKKLQFLTEYSNHISSPQYHTLSSHVIKGDLNEFGNIFAEIGFEGIVIILDEAHNLLDSRNIKQ